jgi:hypothetical protein
MTTSDPERSDSTIICRDCAQPFPFTAGEQEFYAAQGFVPPRRCRDCREIRKTERERARTP